MKLGLLGWPARHSWSPRMQGAALLAAGLTDWTYEVMEVAPPALPAALAELRAAPWRGANVTIPHKSAAMRACDGLVGAAAQIEAVNTIVNEGGRLIGYNTDVSGFRDACGPVAAARCALLGAGGSARAVLHALAEAGAAEVRVVARRPIVLPGGVTALPWRPESLAGCDLLVGCTPPEVEPPPLDALAPGARVMDLVYYAETGLARAARSASLPYQDGRELLLHQGAHAFALWTGCAAPLDVMRSALYIADHHG
jgi:shikimate dehydrogenase